MTPAEIETGARRLMNVVGSIFWSSDEIIGNYLYSAALEMATETFCIENRYTTTSVASQTEYAQATRAIAVKRVEYAGVKLKNISFEELDLLDRDQSTVTTGTPKYYYYFDSAIGLYPTPDTAGDTIKIYTYDQPSALTTASTTISIPSQFHGYLILGTAWYMSFKELGHPNTSRFEFQWNSPSNRHNCIEKARTSMRFVNRDELHCVGRRNLIR